MRYVQPSPSPNTAACKHYIYPCVPHLPIHSGWEYTPLEDSPFFLELKGERGAGGGMWACNLVQKVAEGVYGAGTLLCGAFGCKMCEWGVTSGGENLRVWPGVEM
jgi:hypothetical protein